VFNSRPRGVCAMVLSYDLTLLADIHADQNCGSELAREESGIGAKYSAAEILPSRASSLPQGSTFLRQLCHHRCQRFRRIGRLADRAADDQVIRTRIQRLTRRQNATLIVHRAAGRTNARGHQLQ
jgi:hypothetical protein